ncbi:Inhibitor of apoptosis (IAP) repeat-containing protein [Glarea lozoyensis ATCC 20868]|uniref:Inhibitor of apoptosis (IAP) repeat-containing protein n=1 Tax=Glarea lozoyensis (strain ATCC 20868 / MF5171) TaxID=1116229 RepID=S3DYH6_GLAL2|nr:Inhibitor of apoptosis (IAP) repeat-containing protein [Glarea lozoyensis ATCC 20868]EPE31408.1 Inhibitor of apoptosis (IAP) repeat-containing protein [Glarea lozoyensis ATCC 20868]
MAIDDIAEEYFTYENRLASFQVAHPMPKRRASNASSKSARSIKWPHKTLRPEMLAKAGFFYHPSPDKPDNTACFLCHRGLDGWDEDDDPLVEHLKHSPDCAWALVEAVEMQIEEVAQEYPASKRLLDARKATFGNQWPHETKKGWKCKTKQMADAGWRYTPTNESDDMATCNYCQLALDGWENCDKPLDEHYKRSTDCPFFILIDEHSKAPPPKKSKAKRGSKASRLSTQSQFTATSEAPSLLDLPAEEDDSILTTATNATSKRMAKSKKGTGEGENYEGEEGGAC